MTIILVVLMGFMVACSEQDVELTGPVPLSTEIQTKKGKVVGNARESDLLEFLGIPYAAPPVGDLRWQPHQPLEDWDGELDATNPGLPCMQPARPSEFYARAYSEMSEDCLTLNVWSRAITSADKLPVMFWIHGGA